MEGSSNSGVDCDKESALVTPYQKQEFLKSEIQPINIDLNLSSDGNNSSVASMNESCESPLLSSWDSEPETDIRSVINCDVMPDQGSLQSINLEENYLDIEEQNQFVGVENTDDGLLWEMDNKSYDELLKKFMEKEEELRYSNFRLQLSEQEIIKLNVQVENSEAQLDNVREELKLKEEELNKQKELSEEEIVKLKIQIEKSENQLDNVQEELNLKVEKLQKQIAELDTQIAKKSTEIHRLQSQLIMYESKATNHEQEVQKLKSEMLDLQGKFSLEKDELHFDIVILSKMKIELASKLEDCDSRNKELGNKVRQYEAEKLKQEELHATQQMVLQDEIKCLKEELGQKMRLVEGANKELEMVVIERDEANAKIDKLEVEIRSRDDKLSDIEKYIDELKASLKRQLVNIETLNDMLVNNKTNMNKNERNMLKLRVEELRKEVSRQNGVISDKDEEKREAIRQLCYSLEHYRSRYREELKLKEAELNKLKELSEEEIFKLKIQIEKTENRLYNVREELKVKEEELNKLKKLSEEEIFKLKIQIEKSENRLDNATQTNSYEEPWSGTPLKIDE